MNTTEETRLILETLDRAVRVSRSPGLDAIPVEVSADALASVDQNIYGDIADVLRLLNGKRLGDFDQLFEAILEVKPRVRNLRPHEKKIFDILLARWERFILDDTRGARAQLYAEFHSEALDDDRLRLSVTVRNVGSGEAWGIEVDLEGPLSGEFAILQRPRIRGFRLEPYDRRTLQFEIEPKERQVLHPEFPYRYVDSSGHEQRGMFRTEVGVGGKKADTFSPIENPYVVGIPLATEKAFKVFFNREKTIEYLKAHLGGSILNLYGLRRVGKSSVLRQLPRLLGEDEERPHYLPVYIDVAEVLLDPIKTEADLLYSMAYATYLTLKEMEIEVPRPDETRIGRLPREFFDNYMETISDIVGDRELILMLDEYEAIDEAIQRGRIEASLVTHLDPARFQPKVSLLFSGTRSLEELGWTKLAAGVVASSRIGLFNEEETRKLVLEPIRPHEDEPSAIRYDPLAIQAIWEATAGHPAFVQLLCYFMLEWHNERQLAYMTSQDVDLVIESILESPNRAHIEYFMDGFSKEERLALLILSEALHLRKPYRPFLSRLADRHAGVVPVIDLLNRFVRKGVVIKDMGRYDFSMDLVRRWIDKYEHGEATYE